MTEWRVRLEPAITPLFRAWWRVRRAMTLGVRGIATDDAGRVLLVRHGYVAGWHLPGGGVESGESAVEAIVREMAEEGGLAADAPPELVGFYANHANFPNDHIVLYRFGAWSPCTPRTGVEIAERGFFALDALPEGVTAGTKRRLDEVFGNAPRASTW